MMAPRLLPVAVIMMLGVIVAPLATEGQLAGKLYRIGALSGTSETPVWEGLWQGLRELGWVEGQNLVVERRFAEGRFERLPDLAAELVRLRVDVIVAGTNRAAFPARRATSTIPIVGVAVHDAVGTGLVASLARPGGNITGVESMAPELDAKRLELLREISPKILNVAILYNPGDPAMQLHRRHTEAAAQTLSISVRALEIRDPQDFDGVFAVLAKERPDALLVFTDPFIFRHRKPIVEFTIKNRLPAVYEFKEFVDLGGLTAYGPSLKGMGYRAATLVDKILKGAKPGDLPVEQPTKFDLIINLGTAKALGLTIPPSVLARADEIIQ
jgi:putative ABC transport system substrate-binding protein